MGNRNLRKLSTEKTKRLDTETQWIDFAKTHIFFCHDNKVIKIEAEIGIEIVQIPKIRKTFTETKELRFSLEEIKLKVTAVMKHKETTFGNISKNLFHQKKIFKDHLVE